MSYAEVNIFGVLVSPLVPMMLLAWVLTIPLLRLGDRTGLTRRAWHPSLFNTAIYIVVLSAVVVTAGKLWQP
jgi:protein AaeX